MINALVALLIVVLVVGIVFYLLSLLLDMIPMDAGFKRLAMGLLILIAVLIVIAKALPLLGVHLGI